MANHCSWCVGNVDKAQSVIKSGLEFAVLRGNKQLEETLKQLANRGSMPALPPLIRNLEDDDAPPPEDEEIPMSATTVLTPLIIQNAKLESPATIQLLPPPQPPSRQPAIEDEDEMEVAEEPMASLATVTTMSLFSQSQRQQSQQQPLAGIDDRLSNNTNATAATTTRTIRVNGRPFRVLQMIGRGGSSRVYRVMDSEGELFALKKVNLRNVDRTILDGYRNEIELLREFAGQPHIIRLVDAEHIPSKFCLYILMEYGEIDLGKLLQRQRQDENPSTSQSLVGIRDINFIRYQSNIFIIV